MSNVLKINLNLIKYWKYVFNISILNFFSLLPFLTLSFVLSSASYAEITFDGNKRNPSQLGEIIKSKGISFDQAKRIVLSDCKISYDEYIVSQRRAYPNEKYDLYEESEFKFYYYERYSKDIAQKEVENLQNSSQASSPGHRLAICVLESLLAIANNGHQKRPASQQPATPTQPQVATTPVTLTPQDQRLTQYISAIKARTPSLLAGLSSTQDYLQRKWIVNRTLSAMEQMSPGAAATKYSTGFTEVKKLWNQSRDACKNVTDGELEACINGAYFGSPEDRIAIERAPNTPQSYKPDPKLKLAPVDNVNRCLTIDMKSLFGGFTNSCDFSVMYVYCLENPDKGAWSEAFRCAEGARGIRALGTVSPNKTDVAHTHRGRVIFFACAWQTKPGAGPYGIWGQTTYNEGVGTPGIIRGTCGEQIYAP